jgi:hypothetical protein
MNTKQEPVAVGAIVRGLAVMLALIGLPQLTDVEIETLITAVGALYAAIEILITVWQRSKVTPVAKAVQSVKQVAVGAGLPPAQVQEAVKAVEAGRLPRVVK